MDVFNERSLFQLIKINRLRKEINRLLIKGMSNMECYYCEKRSQNFDFLSLKNLSPSKF